MILGHGSVPFVVVDGDKHPYLNTGQTLTVNFSMNSDHCDNYRDSGFVLWPTASGRQEAP